jgi:hypothetical protein
VKKPSKPEITYADMDIALFKAASSAEKIQYIYYDGSVPVAQFDSAKDTKNWLVEMDLLGCDAQFGFEGDPNKLTPEVEYIDLGVEKGYEVFDLLLEDYKKEANTPKFIGYVSKSTGAEVFRNKLATLKKYKGGRASRKPVHLEAIRKYALSKPDIKQSRGKYELDGVKCDIETDDQVQALAQAKGEKGQLMTFDKDGLSAVGCWILNLNYFDDAKFSDPTTLGFLEKDGSKVIGIGWLFLLAQQIMGDSVDAITGVPRAGKAKAYEVLSPYNNKPVSQLPEALKEVAKLYKDKYGDEHKYKHWETGEEITRDWYDMMKEQLDLLYMLKGSKDSAERSVLKYLDRESV